MFEIKILAFDISLLGITIVSESQDRYLVLDIDTEAGRAATELDSSSYPQNSQSSLQDPLAQNLGWQELSYSASSYSRK